MWPRSDIIEMLQIDLPIVLAPMAGAGTAELAMSVAEVGGLGSLPCAMLTPEQIRAQTQIFQQRTNRPINLNFFCHKLAGPNLEKEAAWKKRLESYYCELGLDPEISVASANRAPFQEVHCELIEELKPSVASFHFGLPEERLVERIRVAGTKILATATTVAEARWLEERGVDAIIAQGAEAGGHRGIFLSKDVYSQPGTMALVPQVVDAVQVPVIAAGGIADGRGIAAAFALGASAVQIGTVFLFCPEAKISPLHARALQMAADDSTVITNVFTGRPARGIMNRAVRELGPLTQDAPEFPLGATALAPLRAKHEAEGSDDFSALWAGQAVALGREMPAAELVQRLVQEAVACLQSLKS